MSSIRCKHLLGRCAMALAMALPAALATTACSTFEIVLERVATNEPSVEELGDVHFAVTTGSPVAQRWFDLGLAWSHAYQPAPALSCFERAVAADPGCAMAWWGIAYASWSHVENVKLDADVVADLRRAGMRSRRVARRALEAVTRAIRCAAGATPRERGLVAAIAARLRAGSRDAADRAYVDAMRRVYESDPDDADVGAMYAEALMSLQADGQWTAAGAPRSGTEEVLAVLERALRRCPEHLQANHLYIHALEASPWPERALPAAQRLVAAAPAAGHLLHMPAHVYVRVGRYADAAAANRRAIEAGRRTAALVGRGGYYDVCRAHDYHFLAYVAMFAGRFDEARSAADELIAELPLAVVRARPEAFEHLLALPVHVLARFGRWQELLALPPPPAWQRSTIAVWRYGRGVALAALGRVDEAGTEREAFRAAVADVPEHWTTGRNPTRDVLAVGDAFLAGEIAFRAGRHQLAFAALREAVRRVDELRWDEPAGWMMPPRHALGALLLEVGRGAEAEVVYREDLRRHPENGWALHGLAECLRRRGADEEAAQVEARFDAAWADATETISASCRCRRDPSSTAIAR